MKKETRIITRTYSKPILLDITFQENNKPKPLVVFCHGYKGFKDWGCWNLLAEQFANAGFFFLKFNFSHNGGTIEQPIDFPDLEAFGLNNFSKELDDLEEVISWISHTENEFFNEVDSSNLSLIGHSRGGGIVTIKAAEDGRVKKVITLAAVSDYEQRFPNGEILDHWRKQGVAYIENTRTKQQMPHYIQFYEDFVANKERLTISRAAKQVVIPHLIVHGTADETVSFKEAEMLHQWSAQSELFAIEGANHVFGGSHPWNENHLPEDLSLVTNELIGFLSGEIS